MSYEEIELKPLSLSILKFLAEHPSQRSQEIAESMGLKTRQVDAAVTRSLVRYGLCQRQAKLTRLLKKEFNVIVITPFGEKYLAYISNREG